jgi:hypothetical protein
VTRFPEPDREQLLDFVSTVFGRATEGLWVPLRTYCEGANRRPWRSELWSWQKLGSLASLADAAGDLAWAAAIAAGPVVFCCPLASFETRDKASEANLAEAFTISVELDEYPERARERAEDLLGPATLVVASGGSWFDPETEEEQNKLHLHWVLREPARSFAKLVKLGEARRRLAQLLGGDPTGAPISHCYRWPDSWHRKSDAVLCRSLEYRPEIIGDLDDAYACIETAEHEEWTREAVDRTTQRRERIVRVVHSGELGTDISDIAAALETIPNPDRAEADSNRGRQWKMWKRTLMAVWAATEGADAGKELALAWSAKSDIHDLAGFEEAWRDIEGSPPDRLGVGTLFYMARQADASWRKPSDIALDPPVVDADGQLVSESLLVPDPDSSEATENALASAEEPEPVAGPAADDLETSTETEARAEAELEQIEPRLEQPELEDPLEPPPAKDDEEPELSAKPVTKLVGGDLPEIIDQVDAILATADPELFDYGDMVVYPAIEAIKTFRARKAQALRLVRVPLIGLIDRATRVIDFQRFDGKRKKWVSIDCPNPVAAGYLARVGQRRLRPLAMITTAPVLRSNGTVLEEPGYDQATGLLYDPRGVVFPKVPQMPSRADALAALDLLRAPFAEFPFVDDAARSVHLAALLSVLARPALRHVPLFAYDSPVPGTGKSKLVECCAMLALGHDCPVISQGDDEIELEKRLGANLLAGDRIIAIDNCDKPLGGQLLCQILTQPLVQVRILGSSKRATLPTHTLLFATGNNFALLGDMLRRGLVCRLDAKTERPELRRFKSEDPVELFRRERARFAVATLTLLRAYIAVGSPIPEIMDESGHIIPMQPLGGFDDWSIIVRDALPPR